MDAIQRFYVESYGKFDDIAFGVGDDALIAAVARDTRIV